MITINKHKIGDVEKQFLTDCNRFWILVYNFKKNVYINDYGIPQLLMHDIFKRKMNSKYFERQFNVWGRPFNDQSLYVSTQNIE